MYSSKGKKTRKVKVCKIIVDVAAIVAVPLLQHDVPEIFRGFYAIIAAIK